MITYSRYGIRVADIYYGAAEPAPPRGVDVVRHLQSPTEIEGASCAAFHTIVIDLGRAERDLFQGFKKGTRYEIRRAAEKDGIQERFWSGADGAALDRFVEFYDRFALDKRLPKANRPKLRELAGAAALALSSAEPADGEPIVWHAYVLAAERARLLHSASSFRQRQDTQSRQRIGRANRYLHWRDMFHFKQAGIRLLDMGGWYDGSEDPERLRINAFKEEFGGTLVKAFNTQAGITWKGRAVVRLVRLVQRWKS
jgi:hypothetical protein